MASVADPAATAGGGTATAADLAGGAADPPADPAGAGTQAGNDAGLVDPDWYSQVSAEAEGEEPSLRDWLKASNVKDLDGLARVARDNMKAVRDSGRFKVPGEGATEAEIKTFRAAIGVPDDPKGYKLPELTDDAGNPVEMNSERLQSIASIAHKHGIPAAALEATLLELAQADAVEAASTAADVQARAEAYAKAWGTKQAENVAAVTRACEALGISGDEARAIRSAITPERALEIFAKLGSGLGEDAMLEGGGRQRFGVSGAEAQKQLDSRMGDKAWVDKALVPGTPENAEYGRLQNAVGEAANRKAAVDAAAG